MSDTDNAIDVLLIDGGLVIGVNTPAIPPMQPPPGRAEQVTPGVAGRTDE